MNTLHELGNLCVVLWEQGNLWASRWLRIMIVLVFIWPIVMIGTCLTLDKYPVVAMFILAVLPLLVFLAWLFCLTNPLILGVIFLLPSTKKPLLLICGALGAEILVGIYLSLVPIALDRGLGLTLILVLVALVLFWRIRRLRTLLIILLLVLTMIFCLGGRTAAKEKMVAAQNNFQHWLKSPGNISGETDKSLVRFQPIVNQVCDDAFSDSPPAAIAKESTTVSIPQGCFGSDTQLPSAATWPSWCYQPYPRNPAPDWQVTFQFLDGNGRVWATEGPYGPMDKPCFPKFPGRFRLQGSGTIRFYAGDCTQPCVSHA